MVFWDNQSTDSSAKLVKSYQDPRIRYFYASSHTLLYEARNLALKNASGEFVAFLDVDDWWEPYKLERQIPLFADPTVAFVYSNYWIRYEDSGRIRMAYNPNLPSGKIAQKLLNNYRVGLLTLVIRRSSVQNEESPFNGSYHLIGDFDLVIRLAIMFTVQVVQEPLATYRVHKENESKKFRDRYLIEIGDWLENSAIQCSKYMGLNITPMMQYYLYLKSVMYVMQGNRLRGWFIFLKLPWGSMKIKSLVCCSLPLTLLKKMRWL